MKPIEGQIIRKFLKAIEPFVAAYQHNELAYIAIRNGDDWCVLHARLRLSIARNGTDAEFSNDYLRAGRASLAASDFNISRMLEEILEGTLVCSQGDLKFLVPSTDAPLVEFEMYHPEGLAAGNRLNVLTVHGNAPSLNVSPNQIDWSLKSGSIPYDNLADLTYEYRLGPVSLTSASVAFICDTVAFIDPVSAIKDGKFSLVVRLASGLDPTRVQVGLRTILPEGVTRSTLQGSQFNWSNDGATLQGSLEMPITNRSAIKCFISYAGVAQHELWRVDLDHSPNVRRAAYEVFDPKLEKLYQIVEFADRRGQEARDFEKGINSLLWMLGFSPVHLDGNEKTKLERCPDILVCTPLGRLALVEVTTGHLGSDKKLLDLVSRRELLSRTLFEKSTTSQILSVIATSMRGAELDAERETAERHKVFVLDKDEIEQMIIRTLAIPDPEALYNAIAQRVEEAYQRHQPAGTS
ncbi:MAG: hypothetical protein AB7S74_17560 [Hyphomicrobium sp.]